MLSYFIAMLRMKSLKYPGLFLLIGARQAQLNLEYYRIYIGNTGVDYTFGF